MNFWVDIYRDTLDFKVGYPGIIFGQLGEWYVDSLDSVSIDSYPVGNIRRNHFCSIIDTAIDGASVYGFIMP